MTRNLDSSSRSSADAASDRAEPAHGAVDDSAATGRSHPETEVRPGETVVAECPYCARPFSTERARDLHVGEIHESECTEQEVLAYDAASEAEHDDLFYFHLRVVAALGILYGVVVLLYMFVLGSGLL